MEKTIAPRQHKGILIACHAWHEDYFGGAFKLAAEFAQYLATQGYDVHFLCGTDLKEFPNPSQVDGMRLWRYRFRGAPSPSLLNLWGHVHGTWALTRRILSSANIGCLNGHSPLQFLGASLALPRSMPCRRVYSVHSPFVKELQAVWEARTEADALSIRRNLAIQAARRLEKMVYRRSDALQCDSAYTLSVISKEYGPAVGTRGMVCPGWVDLERFRPVADRGEIRRQLGPPWLPEEPTFLSVRRLERRMGLENLIVASKILVSEGYQFRTFIGGSGPLRSNLEGKVAEYGLENTVYLLGKIPENKLSLSYAAADCFVLPTRSLECFGLIVLEAYASGTPVIATPIGSIPEVMGNGFHEWLAADITAEALALQMRSFLRGELICDDSLLRRHAEQYRDSTILSRLEKIVMGKSASH